MNGLGDAIIGAVREAAKEERRRSRGLHAPSTGDTYDDYAHDDNATMLEHLANELESRLSAAQETEADDTDGRLLSMARRLGAAENARDALRAQISAVRELHVRGSLHIMDGGNVCVGCGGQWPCRTIRALDGQS